MHIHTIPLRSAYCAVISAYLQAEISLQDFQYLTTSCRSLHPLRRTIDIEDRASKFSVARDTASPR